MNDKIIVLDFGSQYNQLIVRSIRDLGIYSELLPYDTTIETIQEIGNVKGIILSGGPHSAYQENSFQGDQRIFDLQIPILGICYGLQWICQVFGGVIEESKTREYGRQEIKILKDSKIVNEIPKEYHVWMSHGDSIKQIPKQFDSIAVSSSSSVAIVEHQSKPIYGVQFHPEVKHTEFGSKLLSNFIFNIVEAQPNWSMKDFINNEILRIKTEVKDQKVIMGISGGVDSSVAAVLIHRAIGDRLTCMFIDHGLLRKNEANEVMEMFKEKYHINVVKIDAKERFLNKLKGIVDPEQKRKIIGNEFIYVFQEEANKLGTFHFLGQGTLYTDVIESGTKTSQTIKSHHNVGGLPKDMKFKLIEPLDKLFKDEVRKLGLELGIDYNILYRQPFPGPGLAIRVLGEVSDSRLEVVRHSDAILREEIKLANLDSSIWQYFTVLTNVRTVGVMGDQRTYEETIAIRAITSEDGMTADWAKIPYEVLDKISRRIVNEVRGCNRIVYDITSKPPATIEWE